MPNELTFEQIQALVTRAPFHQWLGLTVVEITDDGIEIRAKWREEWVVNIERGYTHGGIIAALIDLAADWAMVKQTGRGVPTIDLRVDYHRPTIRSDLIARGKVVRPAGNFPLARRASSTSTESSSPAAAAPISPRRQNPHNHRGRK